MKKLFTFLMLAAFVAMGFAQQTNFVIEDHGHYYGNVNMDRSQWYGNTTWRGIFDNGETVGEGHAYYFVINEGTVPAGVTLDKITFSHMYSTSWNITNTSYIITLYRNPTVSQIEGSTSNTVEPGTEITHWNYDGASTENYQEMVEVPFETPYVVQSGESLCLKVEFGGPHAFFGLGDYNDPMWVNYYMDCGQGPRQYQFHPSTETGNVYYPVPLALAVHYNDGLPELHQVDIRPALLDPEDDNLQDIFGDTLYVDPQSDAVYCRPIVRNQGMDDAYGTIISDLYMTGENAETVYFWENDTVWGREGYDTLGANYYISWQNAPFALFLFEEESSDEYYTWTEMQELGFTLPFQLCMTAVYYPAPGYNGVDVNTQNDLYCLTIEDIANMPDMISENTNTLNISPNPANTYIRVENAAGSQIFVYNIAGQEVMSIESAEANETLNISNLNAGLYIVRVVNGTEVSTAKVSIVR